MTIRLIILILLLSACRSSDMACPEPQTVRLKKRPSNYLRTSQRNMTASNRQLEEKEKPKADFRQQASRKTISSIDEWDCPRPGSNVIPKSVKENIKKNRKKFETYSRSRNATDSVHTRAPGNKP